MFNKQTDRSASCYRAGVAKQIDIDICRKTFSVMYLLIVFSAHSVLRSPVGIPTQCLTAISMHAHTRERVKKTE